MKLPIQKKKKMGRGEFPKSIIHSDGMQCNRAKKNFCEYIVQMGGQKPVVSHNLKKKPGRRRLGRILKAGGGVRTWG